MKLEPPAQAEFAQAKIILGPGHPADVPAWREALLRWRAEERLRLGYDDSLYQRPEFAWARHCFACHLVLLSDQLLLDYGSGKFTSEHYLEYAPAFGGMDALVLWHAYLNLGFDERNQFDFYQDGPGGLEGLRELVGFFHAQGVRVFLDYNPWDTGTRRPDRPDHEALTQMVGTLEADGVFLDTMRHGSALFRETMDEARAGVVFESESSLPLEHLHSHHMSWAQWFPDSQAPGVLRNKWFEPRHMMHHTRRWERSHHPELQSAWMNGAGILVWENVFGSWNGWHPRDRWMLRSLLPVQRRYADHFAFGEWCPLVETGVSGVYASAWSHHDTRLWTLINRQPQDLQGDLLKVSHIPGQRYFDLIQGAELELCKPGSTAVLSSAIAGNGVGAVLALDQSQVNADFRAFLARQRQIYQERSDDTGFPEQPIHPRPVEPSRLQRPQEGMQSFKATQVLLRTTFRNRECGTFGAVPFVNVWKPKYPLLHQPLTEERRVQLSAYALAVREVSNREYQRFLEASSYRPAQPERFLAHWVGGKPRPEDLDAPAVYVDLEDARAYARWAGKRLPTEQEWQHGMAQMLQSGPQSGLRVWNWTESEYSDGRTHFCILKGGASYQAQGSEWYADGGPQAPDFAAKFLLGSPSLNRRSTIGFRCAVDLDSL